MKTDKGSFSGQGGLRIHWQSWLPEKVQAVVLIAHGVGEHGGRYGHVAEALVGTGCAVYAIDHRGHGQSEGPRCLIDRFAHAVSDMNTMVDRIVEKHARKPVFLLGHSMGGALALSYTMKHGERLAGLALSGPAVALDGAPWLLRQISKLLSLFAPKAGMLPVDPTLVSRDAEMVAGYASDPLNFHGKLPARTIGEIIAFAEWVPAAVSTITLPLLVQHGGGDKLAGVSGSRMIAARAGSKDKTLKVYEGHAHEIFNEPLADRTRVIADLCAWIKARIA
ncbi:MAG: lysophospholipase [Pseudomonadota bacterium]